MGRLAWLRWAAGAAGVAIGLMMGACGSSGGGDGGGSGSTGGTAQAALQITAQPQAAAVDDGAAVSFSVMPADVTGVAYQWQRNGVDIPGATAATLALGSVGLADDGARYAVVLARGSDRLTSAAATLTVRAVAPQVTAAPAAVTVGAGQTAIFSVIASGSAPLAYQWQRNGTDIAGATGASYTTVALTTADNGASFTVKVSNAGGSTTSAAALLAVTSPAPGASGEGTRSLWLAATHTLALRSDGLLMGWGQNSNAQLGAGATLAGSAAVQIATGVAAASTNLGFGLVVDDAGALRGWGSNSAAWLGGTGSTTYTTPQAVTWPARGVRQVEAGLQPFDRGVSFTVVLLTDGTVWHLPGSREVSGSNTSDSPNQVPSLSDVTALAQGHGGAYAVRADGTVWRLTASASTSLGPTWRTLRADAVTGLANVRQVACGTSHCLALLADGTLRAWGEGRNGELGHGVAASSATPVVVSGLTDVTHMAASSNAGASLARTRDGKVWSWGAAAMSARPAASAGPTSMPTAVPSLAGSTEVACSENHCAARKADGTVWAWGLNTYRQVSAAIGAVQEPVQVPGINLTAATGTAGTITPSLRLLAVPRPGWAVVGQTLSFHASAVGRGSALTYQWLRNGAVVAGGTAAAYTTPALVAGDDGARYSVRVSDGTETVTSAEAAITVANVSASLWPAATYTLALKRDGSLLGWGSNASSQLGSGAAVAGSTAQRVASGMTQASAAPSFGLATDGQGGLWGWGGNSDVWQGGSVPISGAVPVTAPVAVTWPSRRVRQALAMLMAGSSTAQISFVLLADGTVWQLPGDKVTSGTSAAHAAVQVPGLYDITALSQGHGKPHAVRSDGSVWAIGTMIGSEPAYFQPYATEAAGLANVRQLTCGTNHCLALLTDGTLRAWGQGTRGELGHGAAVSSSVPVVVSGLGNVTHIAVTSFYGASLARTADGKVWSWGAGELSGRVRAGTTASAPADATLPVEVTGLAGSTELACGPGHCLARMTDGTLRAWGGNGSGQLGVAGSSGDFRQSPVQVPGVQLN